MIEVKHVNYAYDSSLVLHDISISEHEPFITGLWGRNGAGKTTFMKLLAGLYAPDHGEITVMGKTPYNNSEAQLHISYIQENHPFHHSWDINNVVNLGKYFNPNWNQETADYLIEVFDLPKSKKIRKFSKGMKTALQIVLGLSSYSDVTIFDEPTNGLDAVMRKRFYDVLLESYDNHPRQILLSSHHINEIQPLCDKLIAIHNNTILLHESMEDLRGRGILLSGDKQRIAAVTSTKRIIEKSELGSITKVMIDDNYSKAWVDLARQNQLSIDKASLQDYLINIANDHKEVFV